MDAFLPLEDTAHRLSVARRTIARWIVEGKLKVTYNPSGRPIISLSSIKSLEEKIFTVARTVQREEEQALGPAES